MMMTSFIMYFISHPLSMGLFILMQTLMTCLLSGMLIETYWFSYILFLIFLGGLLVLFIYVSSIASNELFKISIKNKFFLLISSMFIIFFVILLKNNLSWMNFFMNSEIFNYFNHFIFINNENMINLSKLYNNHTFFLMMILIIYLFITLVAVIKITNIFYGPLRSNF
uniref:NADH dehydrogenase subunit 6 n=1 Tax=Quasinarosa fulgens TaxID=2567769 RepID=UPI0023D82153|nr:NADH dehydrogenase subunit 6 [Narosa fulgens]WCS41481.1 NADH dehydrogenase subunit 6 [Narosa fulgens]